MTSEVGPKGAPFGRYRLLQLLGSGGMAVVYRALMVGPGGFERPVVIKRILPQHARDPYFIGMLTAEAKLMSRLQHPGIVQLFELGEVNSEYYLAMELVEGWDLACIQARCAALNRPLPVGLACLVAHRLAEALDYAHALKDEAGHPMSIVHRDVSPSNVMVARHGAVKLLDFGVAKAASQLLGDRTRSGVIKGKVSYMAPEQAEGHSADRNSDVFALGIVLYECLTNRRLFRGANELETFKLVLGLRPPPPSSLVPGLDAQVDELVQRMLAREPLLRPRSCGEIAEALLPTLVKTGANESALATFVASLGPLEPAGNSQPTRPVPEPAQNVVDVILGDTPSVPRTPPQERLVPGPATSRNPRRRWAVAALGLGLTVVAAAAAVAALTQARESSTGSPTAPTVSTTRAAKVEAPTPPAARPTVRFEVDGTPGAQVAVDGQAVGAVPLRLTLPTAQTTRAVRVSLTGFDDLERTVAGDRDVVLEANLRRKPAAPKRQPALRKEPRSEVSDPFRR